MLSDTALGIDAWQVMSNLASLCVRDFTVLYLAKQEPVNGLCTVDICQQVLSELGKSQRQQHLHHCVQRDLATRNGYKLFDTHYCYLCFDWIIGDNWKLHCAAHLTKLASKRCGTRTFYHTLVQPGYCPFCLNNKNLEAPHRLQIWTRDHFL